MFYQNWKLSLFAIIMIPIALLLQNLLEKNNKSCESTNATKAGIFNSYFMEILKNHKLLKIFQREELEKKRANKLMED